MPYCRISTETLREGRQRGQATRAVKEKRQERMETLPPLGAGTHYELAKCAEASLILCAIHSVKLVARYFQWEGFGGTITVNRHWLKIQPGDRQEVPELKEAYSQLLQDVAHRVHLAGDAFFDRVKKGHMPGFPRFFRRDEKALAKAQRKLPKQKRGNCERRKVRKVVSGIHERIRNRGHDFCHQNARRIVNRFGVIAVDPAYTSQDCSRCGFRAKKKLSERWHLCPMCSVSLDRDTNAAVNITIYGVVA